MFAAVPLISAFTGGRNLPRSIAEGDGAMAAFDLVMLALAASFVFMARRAARAPVPAAPKRRAAPLPAKG